MKKLHFFPASLAILAIGALAVPALGAQAMTVSKQSSTRAGTDTAAEALRTKTTTQIDNRIKAMNELTARINEMKRLSATEKTSLTASIQTSISDMDQLKTKVGAETDIAAIRQDSQSVTKGYRIYMLVLPQGRIEAAADRVLNIVSLMTSFETKLQGRLDQAKTDGNDTSSAVAIMSDMHAKILDANTQAQAAIDLVSGLQPDNGDKTTAQANSQALKDARTKIKTAIADLKTARQDAGKVVKLLAGFKASSSGSAGIRTNANSAVNSNSNR
jgi:hypothetical protein